MLFSFQLEQWLTQQLLPHHDPFSNNDSTYMSPSTFAFYEPCQQAEKQKRELCCGLGDDEQPGPKGVFLGAILQHPSAIYLPQQRFHALDVISLHASIYASLSNSTLLQEVLWRFDQFAKVKR